MANGNGHSPERNKINIKNETELCPCGEQEMSKTLSPVAFTHDSLFNHEEITRCHAIISVQDGILGLCVCARIIRIYGFISRLHSGGITLLLLISVIIQ